MIDSVLYALTDPVYFIAVSAILLVGYLIVWSVTLTKMIGTRRLYKVLGMEAEVKRRQARRRFVSSIADKSSPVGGTKNYRSRDSSGGRVTKAPAKVA